MKKNIMFKVGLFCTVLVLIATCFITGAFAKYTTSVSGTDTARVAKFDCTVTTDGVKYASDPVTIKLFETADTNVLDVAGDQKLIAPGTSGSFSIICVDKSEVLITTSFTLTEVNNGNIPVYYTFHGNNYSSLTSIPGVTIHGDLEALEAELKMYTATTNIGAETTNQVTHNLEWHWAFAGNDTNDTSLGVKGTDTISLTITVTADQVD